MRTHWGRVALAVAAATWAAPAAAGDWTLYRYDIAGSNDPGEPLTEAQARGFHQVWTTPTPPIANPIVADGTVYVVDGDNEKLDAIDIATGQVVWSRSTAVSLYVTCVSQTANLGAIGAPAVVGTQLIFPGADGYVYSFDKDTGAVNWQTQVANPANDEFLWASTFPADGFVYFGVATYFEEQCGEVPGRLVSLDPSTGATAATWWANASHGPGATIWSRPDYDPETNRLFIATGTGTPADNLLGQSVVALDPTTLTTLDFWQLQAPLVDDYDFGGGPTIYDLDGGTKMLAVINKDGTVYGFDRSDLDAGPVWTYSVALPGSSPDEGQGSIVSPAYANGTLFVGGGATASGQPGQIAALDPATGDALWTYDPGGYVLPPITATGDVIIAGVSNATASTGQLVVLSQSSGALLYQQSTASPIWAEPTYSNGMLFFGDELGQLYALAPGDGGTVTIVADSGVVSTGGASGGTGPTTTGGSPSGGRAGCSSPGGTGSDGLALAALGLLCAWTLRRARRNEG